MSSPYQTRLIRSTALPGLVLDVRWFIGEARPHPYEILQSLLLAQGKSTPGYSSS
jgi:hypothetical protein